MSYTHSLVSSISFRLRRSVSMATRLMIACAVFLSLPALAQEVLPEPAPGLYGPGFPYTMVRQPDGKVIVGGEITRIAGQSVRYVVRYNVDGTLDEDYAPQLDGFVDDMALDSQGRLYVIQRATASIGLTTTPATGFPLVRRIDATGQVDASFAPAQPANAYDHGLSLLLDEEGGALYVNYSVTASPYNRVAVRRYHLVDGSWDQAFALDSEYLINDMIRQDDWIVLGGWFRDINGVARKGLARVNRLSGALDAAWDPATTTLGPGFPTIRTLLLDGTHVLVGGNFQNVGGGTNRGLARISLADGSADANWNTPVPTVYALAKDSQGRVVAFLQSGLLNGVTWSSAVVRFSASGQHETDWGDPGSQGSTMRAVLILPGDHVLSGQSGAGSDTLSRLLRHDANTGIATEFATNLLGTPRLNRAFAVGSDMVLAGPILQIGGESGVGAVRIDASGTGITGWRSDYGSHVNWIQVNDAAVSSEHLYLTGYIGALNNAPNYDPIRRLSLADGTLDASWRPQTTLPGSNSSGRVVVDEAAGWVYVYGSNLPSNPANRYLARLDIDSGALDATWGPEGSFFSILQMALADGFIYLAGNFTTIGGVDLPRLARISVSGNGTPDAGWRPAPDAGGTWAIAFDTAGGWVYAGGTNAAGNVELARYRLSDGSRDAQWAPLAGRAGSISRLVFDAPSGNLYAIGDLALRCNGGRLAAIKLYSGPSKLDPLWRVELGRYGTAADVLPRADGSVLVVGYFDRINGQSRQSTAALGPSNSIFADGMGLSDNAGGCVQ